MALLTTLPSFQHFPENENAIWSIFEANTEGEVHFKIR